MWGFESHRRPTHLWTRSVREVRYPTVYRRNQLRTDHCHLTTCSLFFTLPCSAQFRLNHFCRAHCSPLKSGRHIAGTDRPCELAVALSKFRQHPTLGAPQVQQNRRILREWPTYPRFWDMWDPIPGCPRFRAPVVGASLGRVPGLPRSFGGRAGSSKSPPANCTRNLLWISLCQTLFVPVPPSAGAPPLSPVVGDRVGSSAGCRVPRSTALFWR